MIALRSVDVTSSVPGPPQTLYMKPLTVLPLSPVQPQDRDAGGPPETAARFPSRCGSPAPFPLTGPQHGPNSHSHARTELAAHTAAGVQGTGSWVRLDADFHQLMCRNRPQISWFLNFPLRSTNFSPLHLQEQSLLQPPTLQLLNGMGPLGRRASDGGANIQLHAQLLKRPRGPSPLVASPVRICISVLCRCIHFPLVETGVLTRESFALSQHPIPAVAPVDEEGSDGEPDQEAVQR